MVDKQQAINLLAMAQTRGGSPFVSTGDIRFVKTPDVCVDASSLNWQNVLAVRWSNAQHINILEAQSVLMLLRLIGRDRAQWATRMFLLVDSQVVKHSLLKGRSSSWVLNGILRAVAAITMGTG